MIGNYQQLIDAITSYLYDRKDLLPSIPYFVSAAEAKVHRLLRIRANELLATYTVSTNTITLPANYIETKILAVDGVPLKRISGAEMLTRLQRSPAAGVPKNFARIGSEMFIHPAPNAEDSDVTVSLIYYGHFNGDLAANGTSPIFDEAPDVFLHGALGEASAFLGQDSRIPVWERLYLDGIGELQVQAAEEEYSGTGVAVQNAEGSRYDRAY